MSSGLYRATVLDHYRNPQHSTFLVQPTHAAEVVNQACGDRVRATLRIRDDLVWEIGIIAEGCALTVAGASIVAEVAMGKSVQQVTAIQTRYIWELLGNLEPSAARQRCLSLGLEAVQQALADPSADHIS